MTIRFFLLGFLLVATMGFGFLRGLEPEELINVQSLFIVLGGTVLVLSLGFSAQRLRQTCQVLWAVLRSRPQTDDILPEILRLAGIYRLHGPLALERALGGVTHDFLNFGGTLIAEGYDEWALAAALERETLLRNSDRQAQIRILRTLTRLTPALGMAGTVVSLMQVLRDINHPEAVGLPLGMALSSTLYGLMLANLVFLPLTSKLEEFAHGEAVERHMIIEALLGMQKAEHPLRIAERLNAYDIYCQLRHQNQKQGESAVVPQPAEGRLTGGVI
jgi:chemotaxis protein MotA